MIDAFDEPSDASVPPAMIAVTAAPVPAVKDPLVAPEVPNPSPMVSFVALAVKGTFTALAVNVRPPVELSIEATAALLCAFKAALIALTILAPVGLSPRAVPVAASQWC